MKNKILVQKIMFVIAAALLLLTILTFEEDTSFWNKLLQLGVPILLMVTFLLNLNHYKKQNQND